MSQQHYTAALHVEHSRQYNVQGFVAMAGQILHVVTYLDVGRQGIRACPVQAIALAAACDKSSQRPIPSQRQLNLANGTLLSYHSSS